MTARHMPSTSDIDKAMCGREITPDVASHVIVDVGHTVNCPQCRTIINACRRCLSIVGYTFVRREP